MFYVFLGGGLGSCVRYGLTQFSQWAGVSQTFPWATLLANTLSCLVLGALYALFARDVALNQAHNKLLFMTGFCGGFSTFSTFTLETFQLLTDGQIERALTNIFLNLGTCMLCLLLGMRLV